jgi:hypothetical protein
MSHAVALIAGLIVGGIVGVWVGISARVWRSVYEEWAIQPKGSSVE